jgi:hypothetical protein
MTLRLSQFGKRAFFAPLLIVIASTMPGCGGSSGTVSGSVRFRGESVTAGVVAFFGSDGKVTSAPISRDGRYEASDVPLGDVQVTVSTPPPGPSKEIAAKNPMMKRRGYVPSDDKAISVPARYSRPATSDLRLTVTGGSQNYDIEMQ